MHVDAEDVAEDRLKGIHDALRSMNRQRPPQRAFFPYCARSDLIRCIYGQFSSRQDVFQRWNPVAFPATDFFHDLDDVHQKLHLNRLSKKQSKIGFVSFSGKSVVAVVKINKAGLNEKFVPEIMRGPDVVAPENTPVAVTFCPKEGFNHKTVAGIVIPDYASIKQDDIYIAIHGTSIFKKVRGLITSPGAPIHWFRGNVENFGNGALIKRQVNSLELLSSPSSVLFQFCSLLILSSADSAICIVLSVSMDVATYQNFQTRILQTLSSLRSLDMTDEWAITLQVWDDDYLLTYFNNYTTKQLKDLLDTDQPPTFESLKALEWVEWRRKRHYFSVYIITCDRLIHPEGKRPQRL
ncbi:hypothetical protein Plec18170_008912 [Paecilomyces lecythidis]